MVSPWVVSLNPPIISLPLIVTEDTAICPGIKLPAPLALRGPRPVRGTGQGRPGPRAHGTSLSPPWLEWHEQLRAFYQSRQRL